MDQYGPFRGDFPIVKPPFIAMFDYRRIYVGPLAIVSAPMAVTAPARSAQCLPSAKGASGPQSSVKRSKEDAKGR